MNKKQKKVWCVQHRHGWCACKKNENPGEDLNNDVVATLCDHFITFPLGWEKRIPTCPSCLNEDIKIKELSLLRCPFCGSEPVIKMNSPSSDIKPYPHVICLECGCAQDSVEKWQNRCDTNIMRKI